MKKTELISQLCDKADFSKADSKQAVETILATLTEGIASGKSAGIRGFGSFHRKCRKARLGINPKTKEKIQIESRFVPFFKPGKDLRESVKNSTKTQNK